MTNEEARDQIVIFMCDEQKVINDRDKQALDMAIKALEQKPCNTDTCKVVKVYMNEWDKPITAEPKTGHWEWVQYDYNPKIGNWHCSECRCIVVECVGKEDKGGIPLYKYCPQCGIKMKSQESEG